MPDELRTPAKKPQLLVAEQGGFFFGDPPTHVVGVVDGTTYALIYDGQPKPRLTVDFEGWRVRIDVETSTVEEGGIAEEELFEALEFARDRADGLTKVWLVMRESFTSEAPVDHASGRIEQASMIAAMSASAARNRFARSSCDPARARLSPCRVTLK